MLRERVLMLRYTYIVLFSVNKAAMGRVDLREAVSQNMPFG
jgi:hypothetical protein